MIFLFIIIISEFTRRRPRSIFSAAYKIYLGVGDEGGGGVGGGGGRFSPSFPGAFPCFLNIPRVLLFRERFVYCHRPPSGAIITLSPYLSGKLSKKFNKKKPSRIMCMEGF